MKKRPPGKIAKKILVLAEKLHLTKKVCHVYETKSDGPGLRGLQNFIKEKCYKLGLLQDDVYNVLLSTDEAFTNIMKHGYKYAVGDVIIHLDFIYFLKYLRIEITLKDKTIGFDWESIPEPDLDNYVKSQRRGGFGIFLIKNLVDSIESGKDEIFNYLTLKKVVRRPFLFGVGIKWPVTVILILFILTSSAFYLFQKRQENIFIESQYNVLFSSINDIARSAGGMIIQNNYEDMALLVRGYTEKSDYFKEIFIVNNDNMIIADTNISNFLKKYNRSLLPEKKVSGEFFLYQTDPDNLILTRGIKQNEVIVGEIFAVVDYSLMRVNLSELQQKNLRNFILFLLFAAALIIILVIYFFVSPVKKLFDGVIEIESGKLSRPHTLRGSDEFSQIKRIFNEFAMRFEETKNTLTDAQRELLAHELLKKEMQVAQSIQQTLLPKSCPEFLDYDISAFYKSAQEVGGDYYDFIPISKNKLGIIIADVSGKGVPGSMIMTIIRTAVRLIAPQNKSSKEVMLKLNRIIENDLQHGMFITIFYIILDLKKHELHFSSAGHTPMFLFRKSEGKIYSLNPKGIPVGLKLKEKDVFRRSIKTETVKLNKDDLVVIYTDGISEAMNEKFQQFSQARFIDLIRKYNNQPLNEYMLLIENEIMDFTGSQPQNDDITLVLIKDKTGAGVEGIESKKFNFLEIDTVNIILDIIRKNPEYGLKRLRNELSSRGIPLKEQIIKKELKRLNLTNYEKRSRFSKYSG
ncbi:MAG TPA: HAMP domain-containing protein [Firmicutes bacterium]|nr:HAMP domain-containing protein [Bacillota bacterium]